MSLGFRLRLFFSAFVVVLLSFVAVERAVDLGDRSIVPAGIVAALAAAVLISLLSARHLARELDDVTATARRMAAGDLDIRTGLTSTGDVGGLAAAIDRVADNMSGAMKELRAERDLVAGILDGMQEGVLLVDQTGRISLVNPALRDILLLSTDVVGRPLLAVVRYAALMDLVERVRAKGRAASGEIELTGLKPRRLLVRVAPLASEKGSLLAVFVDVTDLRRLENVRRDFVANVSHELRTPVTGVLSAAETLRGGAVDDPAARTKFIDIIERNAERLRNLIDDLLDLSRIESKEFKLRREQTDIALSIQHVLAAAKPRAEARGVELVSAVDDDVKRLFIDRRALEQVLANLVENAVKYCPGARVSVDVRAQDDHVRIVVEDNGPGIDAKHLPRLFERFYRVDAGRSRDVGGTGLGLSIVKHLVEAMNGNVVVTSAVGKGTTFTVTIPRPSDSSPRLASDSDSAVVP